MSQARIGEKLGSFRLESIVGSGAMGVVYRGINDATGKPAAIKVVSGEISQRGKVYERFMREAEILKQFRHPNIVRFLAVGRAQGTSYIAMEFIQGDTLDKILEKRELLPWREVVDLAIQICEALHYAHEHGVVHRDLKPSNLMLTDDGRIKLTDFGIAKDLDATALTATGRTLGTAAYMAPEQIRGAPAVSHKTDLYALGIVLYQLLVGKPPFEGSSPMVLMHNHLNEKAPRPSVKIEEIPVTLDDLVFGLMAKDPGDRPWDAAAAGHILSELKKKSEKGKSVKMVWSKDGSKPQNPLRLGTATASKDSGGTVAKTRQGSGPGTKPTGTIWSFTPLLESALFTRAGLEIMGMVLALIAIGGGIAYVVWPPSKEYLYQHAKPLMASTKRYDWITARDEYIEPLNRRFPTNPWREETEALNDKILLDQADSRSSVIISPIRTGFSTPVNKGERLYVITYAIAAQASERRNDLEALHQWQLMEGELKPDDPEDREWYLLARKRASALERMIKDRRELVIRQLDLVEKAYRGGRPVEAATLQAQLVEQYGQYVDLADLFQQPNTPLPASVTPPATSPKATLDEGAAHHSEPAKPPEDVPKKAPSSPAKPETKSPKE